MMRRVLTAILLLGISVCGFAQRNIGVGIATPDPSAVLDLTASDKGFLVPRLPDTLSIAAPYTDGLVFYNTTQKCLYMFRSGAGWLNLCNVNVITGGTGPTGATGAQGVTGPSGADGINGTNGTNGTNGANGNTGPTGPSGVDGINGTNGTNGTNGNTGPTGPSGADGTNGTNGNTGPTGPSGVDGINGTNGTNGTNGATGPTGAAGTNGTNGTNGAVGPIGPTGPQGVPGAVGAAGPIGPTGPQGVPGAVGAAGPIGPTGPAGTNGAAGGAGPIGPTGPAGANGAPGAAGGAGPIGPTGPAGTNGANGAPGAAGAVGAAGPTGATGPVGCGTTNYVLKSTGAAATCSIIYDNGSQVGINTTGMVSVLDVNGNARLNGGQLYLGVVGGVNSGYSGIYADGPNEDIKIAVFKTASAVATNFGVNNTMDAVIVKGNTGYTGIGTVTPITQLHVQGAITSAGGGAYLDGAVDGSNYKVVFADGNGTLVKDNVPTGTDKPIYIQRFTCNCDNPNRNTGVPTTNYTAVMVGFNTNSGGSSNSTTSIVYQSGGTWWFKGDEQGPNENYWYVDIMFIRNALVNDLRPTGNYQGAATGF